jgi:hypothetical protein
MLDRVTDQLGEHEDGVVDGRPANLPSTEIFCQPMARVSNA